MSFSKGFRSVQVRSKHIYVNISIFLFIFRFCSKIKRENYHIERSLGIANSTERIGQPAHTITLLPTILLINLLPIDLNYIIGEEMGRILPGSQVPITCVSITKLIIFTILIVHFNLGRSGTSD